MSARSSTVLHVIALAALGAAIFLPDLGQEGHINSRDVRHAEIAREMVESGQYLLPRICGHPYIDKPPFFNWTIAAAFLLSGRVDFTMARLPSALSAIAAMLGIYLLGRRWFSVRAGIFAALIWATSWMVIDWGRSARMDVMMTCFILYAVLLADIAACERGAWRSWAMWICSSAFVGAAVLCKGPVALFFFAVAAVATWRARRGRWLIPLRFIAGAAAVIVAVVGAWALATEIRGPGHLARLIEYQFGEGLVEHPKRIYLYFDQIMLMTAPWSIFAVGAAYWVVRRIRQRPYDPAVANALIIAVCLIVMTLTPNKRNHYLLPIIPMWSLFLAWFLDQAVAIRTGAKEDTMPRRAFALPLMICLVGVAVLGVAAVAPLMSFARSGRLVGVAILATMAALATFAAVDVRRNLTARAVTLLFVICSISAVAVFPYMSRCCWNMWPSNAVSHDIAATIPRNTAVAVYRLDFEPLCFAMNRRIVFVEDKNELRKFLAGSGQCYVVVESKKAGEVMSVAGRDRLRIIERWKIDGKLSEVMLLGASRRSEAAHEPPMPM